ncbi:MAG: carboxypeptidase regulatory-like domain-containing protein [Acidobacteria bacterium]|nr:carboxypeptidase regulatory-like domain-containing protein [Acidobacteriota bacterium]
MRLSRCVSARRSWYSVLHLLLAGAIFLAPSIISAQTGQGTLTGTITDATGAIIPGVNVSIVNQGTGFTYSAVSNEEGIYRTPYLNAGMYQITYETEGFKKLIRRDIQIRSTETLGLNVSLEIGDVVESVEVSAAAQLLETETSTTGHMISGVELNTLPTPQMKIESILWYISGVTSQAGSGHVAGGRSRAFQMTTDGALATNPGTGTVGTARQVTTAQVNMEEVKVLTTALPAEYGHSGGGIMNITYKSGTNQVHGLVEERYVAKNMIHRSWQDRTVPGGAFAFHLMSANINGPIRKNKTFFLAGWQRHHEKSGNNANVDVPSPAMLGGDFSFPQSTVTPDLIYDPDSLVQSPDGSYSRTPFANNMIPQSRFDPVAVNFLGFGPFSGENNRNNQTFFDRTGPRQNLSADTNKNSFRTGIDAKIDHSFSDNHKVFGRYSNARHRSMAGTWQVQLANPVFDFIEADIPIDQRQVVLSDSYVINPTTINEIRVGWNRRKNTRLPASLNENWAQQFGIPNVGPETMPIFQTSTGGQFYFRPPAGKTVDVNANISFQENFTMIRGRHTIKTGYEGLKTSINSHLSELPGGTYRLGGTESPFTPNTGHKFASFLLGTVTRADFTKSLATWQPQWWSHAAYLQDDWKVTQQLTLNLGVRWQTESPYQTKFGQQSQFSPTAIDPLTGQMGALLHPTDPLASRDNNNFQPRIGMAYNFRDNWVFRGGFAVNTLDLWTNGLRENFEEYLATAVIQQAPGNPDIAFKLSQGPPPIDFNIQPDGTVPFIGSNFSGRSASYFDPNMRSPYIVNWNAGIQRQFGTTYLLEFTYQGSAGVGLLNNWNINQIPLDISSDPVQLEVIRRNAQNFRPYTQFGNINHYSNYGHSSFHSGTVKLEKRMSSGLSFTSFYTWSKSIDEASNDAAASGVTFYNRSLEKGRSNHDVAHRWITYVIWDMPFGRGQRFGSDSGSVVNKILGNWQMSAIQSAETGAPMSFTHNGGLPTGGTNRFLPGTLRPDIAAGKTYNDIQLDWDRHGPCRHSVACAEPWADINAFAIPGSFTLGQAGRNIINGPGMFWHQFSLSKAIPVTERIKGTLRVDFTAPFKYPFFGRPRSAVDFRNPQNFGKITGQQGGFSGLGARTETMVIFRVEF